MPTIDVVYMGRLDHEYGFAYWGDGEVVFEAHSEDDLKAMQGMLEAVQNRLKGASPKEALPKLPVYFSGMVWANLLETDAEEVAE